MVFLIPTTTKRFVAGKTGWSSLWILSPLLVWALATPPAARAGAGPEPASVTVVSEPGNGIAFEQDQLFEAPEAAISVSIVDGEKGRVNVEASSNGNRIGLEFVAPGREEPGSRRIPAGRRLSVQNLAGDQLLPRRRGAVARITGQFVITDIQYSASGLVERLSALYEVHCGSREASPLFGAIRFGEPATEAPETVRPAAIDWPMTAVGASGADVPVTVIGGQAGAHVASVGLEGEDPQDFSVTSDDCAGASLAPGARCEVTVGVKPTTSGLRAAQLVVATPRAQGPPSR